MLVPNGPSNDARQLVDEKKVTIIKTTTAQPTTVAIATTGAVAMARLKLLALGPRGSRDDSRYDAWPVIVEMSETGCDDEPDLPAQQQYKPDVVVDNFKYGARLNAVSLNYTRGLLI